MLFSLVIGVAAIILVIQALVSILRTRALAAEVRWLRKEVQRASTQLLSSDRNEILSGLQTIAKVNDPTVRLGAIRQIEGLTHSEDEEVAYQASLALRHLFTPSEASGRDARRQNERAS